MDVTPRELREIDFRTEWKGYHRDDVDDLLERAAATIEAQNERVRQATERIEIMQADAVANPPTRETEDMLRRTLVLAQRTADEAVAEAQTEARRLTEEAEGRARRVVSEAEANARRVAEGERQRLEAEVVDLGARREALLADVDQLERFSNEYRTRLRSAIERDLDTLAARAPVTDTPRPTLHEVDVPPTTPETPPAAPSRPSAPPLVPSTSNLSANHPPARSAPASVPPLRAPTPEPAAATSTPPAARAPSGPPEPSAAKPAASEPDASRVVGLDSTPESHTIELDRVPAFDGPEDGGDRAARNAEPLEPEVLDDDAFFASLREAVSDDSPLGPRSDDEIFVDEGSDAGRFGNVFKRRR